MSNSSTDNNPPPSQRRTIPDAGHTRETRAYNDHFVQEDPRPTLTAAVLAGSFAATPASARNGQNAAFSGGLVGGLAVGALAGGFGGGHGHGYGFGGGYYNTGYNDCYIDSQPRYNHWGDVVGYRRVRVCN